ncbi:hypothetical protein GCM10010191_37300 [Actinomadura vinacea]|uniref:XRE family transcriptional regulator n=2 Tax=Actinomadura vinacea TaxID=115336 RepID=A0ABN3J4H1_9ACTN
MVEKLPEELRELAISLRKEGRTYREIAGSLGVSISTCSLWLRDVPAPPRPGHEQERVAAMWQSRWAPYHEARERERHETKLAASSEFGDLDERDILLAGALVYWCEGSKDKIYRRQERLVFINSDPALVRFFLRFLQVAGVPREHLRFQLHIHETADIPASTRFWAELTGTPEDAFQKPVIKGHKPKTKRKNLVEDYHGCLCVRAVQSADLYPRVEGWAYGAMLGAEEAAAHFARRSEAALDRLADDQSSARLTGVRVEAPNRYREPGEQPP